MINAIKKHFKARAERIALIRRKHGYEYAASALLACWVHDPQSYCYTVQRLEAESDPSAFDANEFDAGMREAIADFHSLVVRR